MIYKLIEFGHKLTVGTVGMNEVVVARRKDKLNILDVGASGKLKST
jgi:hypothetical protein